MAQEFPDGAPMKPEMTEFWNPEVTVVTPGVEPAHAPSDAVVLFDVPAKVFSKIGPTTKAKNRVGQWLTVV